MLSIDQKLRFYLTRGIGLKIRLKSASNWLKRFKEKNYYQKKVYYRREREREKEGKKAELNFNCT